MFESMKSTFVKVFKQKNERNLAVFVDGPNILRKELGVNLSDIRKNLKKFGKVKIGKVFVNQFASDKLLEAIVNQGFEAIITVGDIDVSMVADSVEAVYNSEIDSIVFVTRDSDFLPALIKAKRAGKETIVMLCEEMSAAALKNTADHLVILKGARR